MSNCAQSLFITASTIKLFKFVPSQIERISAMNNSALAEIVVLSDHLTDPWARLNTPYAAAEGLVSTVTIVGNLLVLVAFKKERKLRRRTNYYIASLAIADLLVGLIGIPCAILASVGLPRQLHMCLFSISLLIVLCTISIFSLLAVSLDRYWAILYPMSYSRHVSSKFALGIICLCWLFGGIVGVLPLFGWYNNEYHEYANKECLFTNVMDYNYLVFLYFTTIVGPALLLAAFYSHIYNIILKQLRQMVSMNETCSLANGFDAVSTVRILTEARRKEVKATQNLSIIVLFFIFCWMPLYTINCIQAFCKSCTVSEEVMNSCIILSHLNSAGNPLLYAYRLSDFRSAFKGLLFGAFSSSSSTENIVIGGTQVNRHFEDNYNSSLPKRKPFISISFNPQRYRFSRDSRKLFKFEKNASNFALVDIKPSQLSHMRPTPAAEGCHSNEKYFYGVFSSSRDWNKNKTLRNDYTYFNSSFIDDYSDDSSLRSAKRKRIQSVQDDASASYILINEDSPENNNLNYNPAKFSRVDNAFLNPNMTSNEQKILKRRHSTNM